MVIISDKKKAASRKGLAKKNKGFISLSTYFRMSKFLDDFFLTRGSFRKVKSMVADLSVYTSQEIKVYAVRVYAVSALSSMALIVAGAIIFRDFFSTLLVLLYAIIMNNVLIHKQIDSVHFKLLKQLSMSLSSLRQNYLRLNSIPQAVAETETGSNCIVLSRKSISC